MVGENGEFTTELRADCSRCFGLCCVAPAFAVSADFALDKDAGRPCPNLRTDFRCGIHRDLRQRGFPGCAAYDCFGAGQRVAQDTFGGRDWRRAPETAQRMFDAFTVMRQLHELLWYLTEALALRRTAGLHAELRAARDRVEGTAALDAGELLQVDAEAVRRDVAALLLRVSELARASARRSPLDRSGEDLVGADLRRADLRGANLGGTTLVGADLRGADLRFADLIGADLRAADLRGADLREAIFLVQSQLEATRGDLDTRLPPTVVAPRPWALARR
jgi:uncharacterized protein YjbI with pentapeptide repeats